MKTIFKITELLNIIGLMFLLFGPYGIAITGGLQVLAGALFIVQFPRNKLIYIYFLLVILFFTSWGHDFTWLFALPIFLIFFLTFILYKQKRLLK